jgi:hypothetical protein
MGVEPLGIGNVAKGKFIQLLTSLAPKRMKRKKNGPCEKQSHAAYYREYIEVSKEEEPFER